jgi:DNA polymerase III subunit delta
VPTPEQFLASIQKQRPAAAYLFLGPEPYMRRRCREALIARALPERSRDEGYSPVDLAETTLAAVIDDARSLSLFARERLIWVHSAETALPRRLSSATGDEEGADGSPIAQLSAYLNSPTPGTVLVFEASRYDFSGDDKAKLERVAKYYDVIPQVVEFRPLTAEAVRDVALELAHRLNLQIGNAEMALLTDAVGGDASRLAAEMEKLYLFAGPGGKVTTEAIRRLVPNASQTTIFALVNALGRKDRAGALRSLDLLVRDGEYLPLALTFLATQFRLALAAKEAQLSNANQAVSHFSRHGVRMWRDRAEQLIRTAESFSTLQIECALKLIYAADKGLRDTRPDDRVVMEMLVLEMTL